MKVLSSIPLGSVEPHSNLLKQPSNEQRLYKILSVENFLKSLTQNYLHFQRVDNYKDTADAEQLPLDRTGNTNSKFVQSPFFTAAHYYDSSRSRAYACCFSLENSNYIWENYGNEAGGNGKVCLVFNFGKLRQMLNQTMQDSIENSLLIYGTTPCHQIFSINYGIVEYVERERHRLNTAYLPNPIQYLFLKEKKDYDAEKELRITLSALGIGKFVLDNGEEIEFTNALPLSFDFRTALKTRVIEQLLFTNTDDSSAYDYLLEKLAK